MRIGRNTIAAEDLLKGQEAPRPTLGRLKQKCQEELSPKLRVKISEDSIYSSETEAAGNPGILLKERAHAQSLVKVLWLGVVSEIYRRN